MGRNADIIAGAIEVITGRLRDAGIQVALTQADLNPPAVLLRMPVITYKLGGCARLTWSADLVAGNVGNEAALSKLVDLVDAAGAALGWPFASATPTDVDTTQGTLPGYRVTW